MPVSRAWEIKKSRDKALYYGHVLRTFAVFVYQSKDNVASVLVAVIAQMNFSH